MRCKAGEGVREVRSWVTANCNVQMRWPRNSTVLVIIECDNCPNPRKLQLGFVLCTSNRLVTIWAVNYAWCKGFATDYLKNRLYTSVKVRNSLSSNYAFPGTPASLSKPKTNIPTR
jgi:hypothetical protein